MFYSNFLPWRMTWQMQSENADDSLFPSVATAAYIQTASAVTE
jgi:hypothetical protein